MSLLATKNGEIKGENRGGYIGLKRGWGRKWFSRGTWSSFGNREPPSWNAFRLHFCHISAKIFVAMQPKIKAERNANKKKRKKEKK